MTTSEAPEAETVPVVELDEVTIRFAGDSGDGMQLAGTRFTVASAVLGNDLSTLPDFPAEIRAPAGTLAGVSAFQLHFSDHDVLTPGDRPNVLVAMNPAALKKNLGDLAPGGTIIVNEDSFDQRSLDKAGYAANPLDDEALEGHTVYRVPMTTLTLESAKELGAKPRTVERSKNFFALGLLSWMYSRPTEPTLEWIDERFGAGTIASQVNEAAFRAGYNFGESTEVFEHKYAVKAAPLTPGKYRSVTGNLAATYGLIAAAHQSGLPLFLGSYPITPASEILEQLSKYKNFGVYAFQAEDEIAGIGSAVGAAYAGCLAVTTTSGPGLDLKAETAGLAVMLELPLIIVDVQRAGPSTGLPTKTEQGDLLQAVFGRHGESPAPVLAAQSPVDCFWIMLEAARIAVKYRTPVYVLTDGYLANGSEPWLIPSSSDLPLIEPGFTVAPNHNGEFWPYERDPETLARPWVRAGTPGLAHRIGGLEKLEGIGTVSYDSDNHDRMVRVRAAKVAGIAADIPAVEVDDPDGADVLVLGWGSTYGAITDAVRRLRADGTKIAQAHLRHVFPFPENLGGIVKSYRKVLVPEINLGQLAKLLRAEFLVEVEQLNVVKGLPLKSSQVQEALLEVLA